jgi:hypothetical protein
MPLISNTILVEGPGGEAVTRQYYTTGKPLSPYGNPAKDRRDERYRRVRALMHKKVSRDQPAYTWSMGYNNLVGRYSPGGNYAKFSGSSLNRKPKQSKLSLYGEGLQAATDYLIAVVRKAAANFARNGASPASFYNWFVWQDDESAGELRNWLSSTQGALYDLGVPIHVLSARSRGKIKDKATAFFRSCPGSRVFCTLSFIASVDDRTGVAILNKFLVSLRKEFINVEYLWVAERQMKTTGNVHFHMIFNKRLPVGRWNAMWVLQQYNAGLVGKDKWGNEVTKEQIMEAYAKDVKEKFINKRVQKIFNPFDIKRVGGSVEKLSNYLTKYITKQEKHQPFGCAVWHCSRRVSRLFTRATVGPSAFRYMLSFRNYGVNKETGEVFEPRVKKEAFYVIVYAQNKSAPLQMLRELEQVNKWLMEGMEGVSPPEIDDEKYAKFFCKENVYID